MSRGLEIEEVAREAMCSSDPPSFYYTVYGDRGVGKPCLVEKVAAGRKGVVRMMIGSADNIDSIISKVMFAVTGQCLRRRLDVVTLRAA